MTFAEPLAATNFSFLRGASHPHEMVARAHALGMAGIGIADRNSLAGVVRAHRAWQAVGGQAGGFRLILGARLVFADDTPDMVAYPMSRLGWGRLTRLLTLGNRRAVKGDCILYLADLLEHGDDLLLIALGGEREFLGHLKAVFQDRLWLGATMHQPRRCREVWLRLVNRRVSSRRGNSRTALRLAGTCRL